MLIHTRCIPFDRLIEELGLARDTSRSAVFDVMLDFQNNEENKNVKPINADQIEAIEDYGKVISKFDITVFSSGRT